GAGGHETDLSPPRIGRRGRAGVPPAGVGRGGWAVQAAGREHAAAITRGSAVIEPLRVEVVLDCSVEHAFATWTERFSSWWPRGHSVTGDPAAVTLEPQVGGRIYERTHDGEEIDWGLITAWDPPHRLRYR